MNTMEWIEDKSNLIDIQLNEFFKKNEFKLQLMNTYPIICNYLSVNNDIEGLEQRSFEDHNVLFKAFMKYQNIISKINERTVFVASKENFCFFMGWTTKFYDDMLSNTSEEVKAMMEMINDYIIDSQLSAGQQGLLKANLTKFRAQTLFQKPFVQLRIAKVNLVTGTQELQHLILSVKHPVMPSLSLLLPFPLILKPVFRFL